MSLLPVDRVLPLPIEPSESLLLRMGSVNGRLVGILTLVCPTFPQLLSETI